jgi:hypothetical protein
VINSSLYICMYVCIGVIHMLHISNFHYSPFTFNSPSGLPSIRFMFVAHWQSHLGKLWGKLTISDMVQSISGLPYGILYKSLFSISIILHNYVIWVLLTALIKMLVKYYETFIATSNFCLIYILRQFIFLPN